MPKTSTIAGALELSIPERILLVQDIWDSIAAEPEAVELTEWQKEELDRRLESYRRNPDDWQPWHEVLAEIRGRR